MNAIVSGQAGSAVIVERERCYAIRIDSLSERTPCDISEIPLIFEDATDIVELSEVLEEAVLSTLEQLWNRDRCLQLLLILLDDSEFYDIRSKAAQYVDEMLLKEDAQEFIGNRLYCASLPKSADLEGALRIAESWQTARCTEFLAQLASHQSAIAQRRQAWEELPDELFNGPDVKNKMFVECVESGAFRLFVTLREQRDLALFSLLTNPQFRGDATARRVLSAWAAPFRESTGGTDFGYDFDDDESDEVSRDVRSPHRKLSIYGLLKRVNKQKDAIRSLIKNGDRNQALKFTDQLIENQRQWSEQKHIAMSLCDLAQFAKSMGDTETQLLLVKKAVEEAPSDSWSYAQLGDAYRTVEEYPSAIEAYQKAGQKGDRRVALLGRAEIMKDLGRLDEALPIYEEAAKEFPEDLVSRNSHAAALAQFGKLEEALSEYDAIVRSAPYDVVGQTGRAQVLRQLGRYEQALSVLADVVRDFPHELIPQVTSVEVLRELGNVEEALERSQRVVEHFPNDPFAHNLFARMLREAGQWSASLAKFQETKTIFPTHPTAYLGVGDTHKRLRELDAALEAYDEAAKRFPKTGFSRNAMAAVLSATGDYDKAIALLPDIKPATNGEWIAFHIRGMIELRRRNFEKALEMMRYGLNESPWVEQQSYFRAGIAIVMLHADNYQDATLEINAIDAASLITVKSVLTAHALHATGRHNDAATAHRMIPNSAPAFIHSLTEQISAPSTWVSPQNRDEILVGECDALLLAA